jgi:hypothetical protein
MHELTRGLMVLVADDALPVPKAVVALSHVAVPAGEGT